MLVFSVAIRIHCGRIISYFCILTALLKCVARLIGMNWFSFIR